MVPQLFWRLHLNATLFNASLLFAVGRRGPPPSIQQATAEATKAAWANTPVGGGGPPRPPQHQLVQPPAPQQQQARGPGPSQQSTQLLSQQQQRQQLAGGPRAGGVQPRPQASMQPQQQQQQQQIGSGRSPTLHGPLQELNGAPSGGASMCAAFDPAFLTLIALSFRTA